ncbi:hypothetical protein WJX81_005415 [Elliptochloris bilobata]|uniref:Methyltransferase small domain-containing protein n=1 Tax=Elliptochloris bilobata TaxID=381761 RepID=A0AAW1SIX2_9CHLO
MSLATGDHLAKDGGPTAKELVKELDWLLDDAVEACCGPGAQRCVAWRDLQRCAAGRAASCTVALRLELQGLGQLWHQRLDQRAPLQYLCNLAHWRDVTLAVGPGVLIPRPETELLVDFAQEAQLQHPELREGAWADLGTGSGALAIGLASILPQGSRVLAVDCSPAARAWAQLNVRRLGLSPVVEVIEGHWYSPLHQWQGQLCGVLSNPPYINSKQLPSLQAEIKLHEPSLALDGGCEEGAVCLREVCEGATRMLRPGGFLAVETAGGSQADSLAAYVETLREQGDLAFKQVALHPVM